MSLTNPTTYNTSGSQADGHSATIGATSDASTATTLVGLLKKLVSLLPASLVSGRLDTQASQATAANLNATAAQGAGSGSAATFWYTRNTDGTNTMPTMDAAARSGYQRVTDGTNTAAVKAASTAAAASDPSVVVAVSPNSPATVVGGAANSAAVSGNPVLTAGYDGTNARTIRTDSAGRAYPAGHSSYNTGGVNETRTVRTGAGHLVRLVINPGTMSTFTVYDNTAGSGTVLASQTTGGAGGGNGYSVEIGAAFSTGLTYISTGGCNVTLIYDAF